MTNKVEDYIIDVLGTYLEDEIENENIKNSEDLRYTVEALAYNPIDEEEIFDGEYPSSAKFTKALLSIAFNDISYDSIFSILNKGIEEKKEQTSLSGVEEII